MNRPLSVYIIAFNELLNVLSKEERLLLLNKIRDWELIPAKAFFKRLCDYIQSNAPSGEWLEVFSSSREL